MDSRRPPLLLLGLFFSETELREVGSSGRLSPFLTCGQVPVFHLKCLWIYTEKRSHLSSVNHLGASAAARHVPGPIYDPWGKSNGTRPSTTLGGRSEREKNKTKKAEIERREKREETGEGEGRLVMLLFFPVCSGCFCDAEWNSCTTEPTAWPITQFPSIRLSIHPSTL